jgi:amino acid permease
MYTFSLAHRQQDLGGGPNHDRLGFRYWKEPGPFVQYANIGGDKVRTRAAQMK